MYYYLEATPTNSYLKMLYKYPQKVFPYDDIRRVNAGLGDLDEEYDTKTHKYVLYSNTDIIV